MRIRVEAPRDEGSTGTCVPPCRNSDTHNLVAGARAALRNARFSWSWRAERCVACESVFDRPGIAAVVYFCGAINQMRFHGAKSWAGSLSRAPNKRSRDSHSRLVNSARSWPNFCQRSAMIAPPIKLVATPSTLLEHGCCTGRWAELSRNWPVLAAAMSIYAVSSSFSRFDAVAKDAQLKDFDISLGLSSTVGLALMVVGVGPQFCFGYVIDRFGAPKLLAFALFLHGITGIVVALYIDNYWTMIAIILPNVALSSAAQFPTFGALVSGYFHELVPFAYSAVNSGYSIAGMLFPPIFATLVSAYGWRVANVIICGFGLLVGILVLCFLRVGPLPTRRPARVTAGATDPLPGMSFEDARCTPTFYCLYLCMLLGLTWEGAVVSQLVLIFQWEAGLDLLTASSLYSLQYLFAIIGKQSFGVVQPYVPRHFHFVGMPLLYCLSHLLLNEPQPQALLRGDWANGFAITQSMQRLLTFAVLCTLPARHAPKPPAKCPQQDLTPSVTLPVLPCSDTCEQMASALATLTPT